MTNELALAIQNVQDLSAIVRELRDKVFILDNDYGVIPGTNGKPVLLLPGMEKLMRALRLVPKYVPLTVVEDFDKPLFFYRYECQLIELETGFIIGSAIGSANSHESKWRWREQKRTCPNCGKETINKSKYSPKNNPNAEPGWYCYAKIGGCGAEFAANDTAIISQATGRVENMDVADQMNTIDKIAQKRALASAIKTAANVSEFFTVDMEDLPPMSQPVEPESEYIPGTARSTTPQARTDAPATTKVSSQAKTLETPEMASTGDINALFTLGATHFKQVNWKHRNNTIKAIFDEGGFTGKSEQECVEIIGARLAEHQKGSPEEIAF